MKELNNIKIIAVDHGYGNIKTANTVTPTGVTAYETEPIFSGNILEHGGIYYRIGEGHKAFIADKAMDEDYYILPLTWIRKQREDFRSYLLRKEVDFRFNGKDYHIRFVGCSLFPQGYPASSDTFNEANRQIDNELKEQPIQKKKRSINEQLKAPQQEVQQPKKQKKKDYER